ncbi:MAG TPA: Ig-like domain-containing protein [Gemmatimonadales bacterium]|jgi:uncharacterized protein YjdB|nr:Ig-like domain-containing protein [Gemmatimonadales bacterium]
MNIRGVCFIAALLLLGCVTDVTVVGPLVPGTGTPGTGSSSSVFLNVTPTAATLNVGTVVELKATVRDTTGSVVTGLGVGWTSSNEAVATVSRTGVVSGVSDGSARITATMASLSASASILVSSVAVASVDITPATATVQLGEQLQLTATARDATGAPVPGRTAIWTSDAPGVARVDASGHVTTLALGSAEIEAEVEGHFGTATVSVVNLPVASVVVTPNPATVSVGLTVQLTASPRDAGGNPLAGRVVTWGSSAPAVATVSASGVVTGVASGTVTITATSEGQSGTSTVTVSAVPVASVQVTPARSAVTVGATVQLSAALRDANGNPLSGRVVTWATTDPAIANVGSTGLVTGVAVGAVTITATSEGQSGTADVTVGPVPVASVTVTPSTASVLELGTVQLTATLRDAAGNVLTGRSVTWSSGGPATASVSTTGLVTGQVAGSATITASSEGQNGTAAITVTRAPVASVTVTPTPVSVLVGASASLTVTLRDANGALLTGRVVTWATSAPGVATVSATGVVSGVAAGGATITATSEGQTGTASVTVSDVPVASVVLSPPGATVFEKATTQLTATAYDGGGNVLAGRSATWSSGAPQVATVNGAGLVTGVTAGAATITATIEGKTATAAITVTPAPVASVTVAPATVSVYEKASVQLTATLKDANGNVLTGRLVTWSTSNGGVATVSTSGLVTGVSVGAITITATSEGQSGGSAVTVTLAPVATVTVAPAGPSLQVGGTLQLTATLKDLNGNVLTGRVVTWGTSAPGVVGVSPTGLATGLAVGSGSVTATSEGKVGTTTVTVIPVPVASVTVSPAAASVLVAGTVQLTATTRDAGGNVLTGRTVTWSSGTPGVATVTTAGLVRGVAVGTATITATSEGKQGTATITVTQPPVATVTVTPAATTLQVGGTVQLTATTRDAGGNILTGRIVTWGSSSPGVASVSGSGAVLAVAVGAATMTATSEGQSGTAAVTVTSAPVPRAGWYAAPTGTSGGDGSVARPWDLATALRGGGGKIRPGDTLWLRGGSYLGAYSSTLAGTAAAPIVVRQYPGERATIDVNGSLNDGLYVSGTYATYWGFEIMNSSTDRTTVTPQRPHGIVNYGSHNRYVNLIIHDNGIGFYNYTSAADVEIYGCLFYNNGWQGTKGGGHAIYVKSSVGPLVLHDNIAFTQFAYGLHAYTNAGSGELINIHMIGNVSFNNGTISALGASAAGANIIMGGEEPVQQGTMVDNMTYFSPGLGVYNIDLGFQTTVNVDLSVQNNYVVGGRRLFEVLYWQQQLGVNGNTLIGPDRMVVLNDASTVAQNWGANTYYRDPAARAWQYAGTDYTFSGWKTATGLAATDQTVSGLPTATRVFVRPNLYEPGRGTIVVYNWGSLSSVAVNLAGVLQTGDTYEVLNAQDYFGTPVTSGTYGGGTINVPMGGVAPPVPIGGSPTAPVKTGPAFDVFVVRRVP